MLPPETGAPSAPEHLATILVVDDLAENRLLIRHLFDEPGYRVLEAADGAEGLAVAERERPDCILLDLSMPGLHGFQVLERLQKDARLREIPVLILTASDESIAALDRGLRGGAVDYIIKPISPPRVFARVRGAIERRRLLQEVQTLRANFTSMLVHDLRGPLTVFRGYLELLSLEGAGPVTERQRRYLTKMADSSGRMLGLIAEILDLSKLEAGKLTLQLQPSDISALVADILERLDPVARQRGIVLQVLGTERRQPLVADPERLDQVLMNLVGNALKFTPQGGMVTVDVVDRGEDVEVGVRDSGPGILPDELPRLFEPFSQTAAGQAAGGGTGLGLFVSRHLVEAHGGRIWAASELGGGAQFSFRLPRRGPKAEGPA